MRRAVMYNERVNSSENTHPPPSGPRIYVASLSDYNNGRLVGRWLDVGVDIDALREGVRRMLTTSSEEGAEDWAIHDYEGFYNVQIPENTRLGTVIGIAASIRAENETPG